MQAAPLAMEALIPTVYLAMLVNFWILLPLSVKQLAQVGTTRIFLWTDAPLAIQTVLNALAHWIQTAMAAYQLHSLTITQDNAWVFARMDYMAAVSPRNALPAISDAQHAVEEHHLIVYLALFLTISSQSLLLVSWIATLINSKIQPCYLLFAENAAQIVWLVPIQTHVSHALFRCFFLFLQQLAKLPVG